MINIQTAAIDIAALMPRRCPTFLRTLRDTIDNYCDDPSTTLAEKSMIADAVIDILI